MRQFGKFRLVEHLASGGMADVWRAEAPGPAGFVKEVALKLVRGEHREDDAFTRMFIQEARLASRLDHANVVHVHELGEVDGQYYIAMELVRGHTLREVLDRCRAQGLRFGVARAVHVCAEVARALAYAHRLEVDGRPAGLVHRDVSPQNILVSREGEVKLADFGIARAANAEELTRAGTIKGKLAYMAPEQARGEPVDGRADVFALGAVLWELCAGRRLFAREGDAATLAAVIDGAPVSRPSEWNEAVGPELDDVVLAALERDRERRIRSDELERRLAVLRMRIATDPDEIDLRAFLLRLWPSTASAAAQREPTAVMGRPPVSFAAELAGDAMPRAPAPDEPGSAPREPPPPEGAVERGPPDLRDAPTQTLTPSRPFPPARQNRRTLLLLSTAVFAVAFAAFVLRWSGSDRAPEQPASADGALAPRRAADRGPANPDPDRDRARTAPRQEADADRDTSGKDPGTPSPREALPAPTGAVAPAAPPPAAPGATPRSSEHGQAPSPQPQPPAPHGAAPHRQRSAAKATLVVDVLPWATVYVDGKAVGDTPLTIDVASGPHRLRAEHPRLGNAAARVELSPGQRFRWAPQLSR